MNENPPGPADTGRRRASEDRGKPGACLQLSPMSRVWLSGSPAAAPWTLLLTAGPASAVGRSLPAVNSRTIRRSSTACTARDADSRYPLHAKDAQMTGVPLLRSFRRTSCSMNRPAARCTGWPGVIRENLPTASIALTCANSHTQRMLSKCLCQHAARTHQGVRGGPTRMDRQSQAAHSGGLGRLP